MTKRFASLFSGCGGLDLGFMQAGLACIAAFDIDKSAVAAYRSNIGAHIQQIDIASSGREVAAAVAAADILVAGPPCQGFSTAGKNDPQDVRNSLLLEVAEIAAQAKPEMVLIENVRGLLGPRFQDHWNALHGKLESCGYTTNFKVVQANDFGVAQRRNRVIIVASRDAAPFDFAFQSSPQITLRDVLSDIDRVDDHAKSKLAGSSMELKIAKQIRPGQKLSNVRGGTASVHTWDIPEVFGSTTSKERNVLEKMLVLRRQNRRRSTGDADPVSARDLTQSLGFSASAILSSLIEKGYVRQIEKYYDLTNAFNGKFRRLQWDDLAPTVDTRFGQPRYFLHPEEHRGFSVREAARIQGFPDSFKFDVADSVAYRLIGNAVPPPMAKSIATLIKRTRTETRKCKARS
jgi:DNA (cytosine-5)-methyltransferase 1